MTLERAAGEGGGFTTSAKLKLDELFVTWLSYQDTYHFISSLISSFKGGGAPPPTSPSPSSSPRTSPRSPPSPRYGRGDHFEASSPPSPHRSSSLSLSPRKSSPRTNRYNRGYTAEQNGYHRSPPLLRKGEHPSSSSSSSPSQQQQAYAANIPRFYFPPTHPQSTYPPVAKDEVALAKISSAYGQARAPLPFQEALPILVTASGLPSSLCQYLLEKAIVANQDHVSEEELMKLWRTSISGRDSAAVLFDALRQPNTTTLHASDFRQFLRLILETHPGLSFLANTPEFQDRYLETVLVRIFYNTPKGFTGKMSLTQLRKSGFLQGLTFIDTETDINKSIDFFSYEHFYVVYCKFWELDTDHDLIISADDLMRYSGGAPTRRIAERICSTPMFPRNPDMAKLLASKMRRQRGPNANKKAIVGLMTYEDFVWFILSEEDRDSSTALEYWFRMIDIDEDGYWSSFELEYFYTDMMPYLRDLGMEPPPFEDLLCQWLDMLSPHYSYNTTPWDCPTVAISLADLKRSKLGKAILHSLVSPSKFLALETKDPFADPAGKDGASDWLRFAQVEYELAVADQAGGLDQSGTQSGEEE